MTSLGTARLPSFVLVNAVTNPQRRFQSRAWTTKLHWWPHWCPGQYRPSPTGTRPPSRKKTVLGGSQGDPRDEVPTTIRSESPTSASVNVSNKTSIILSTNYQHLITHHHAALCLTPHGRLPQRRYGHPPRRPRRPSVRILQPQRLRGLPAAVARLRQVSVELPVQLRRALHQGLRW